MSITPLFIAILSIAIGILPLLISMLASTIARFFGCHLSEAGIDECERLSERTRKTLYGMFTFAWMTMFSGGIAVLGISASIIWAIARQV